MIYKDKNRKLPAIRLYKGYEQRIGIARLGMIYCIRNPMLMEMQANTRFKELTDKMAIRA